MKAYGQKRIWDLEGAVIKQLQYKSEIIFKINMKLVSRHAASC